MTRKLARFIRTTDGYNLEFAIQACLRPPKINMYMYKLHEYVHYKDKATIETATEIISDKIKLANTLHFNQLKQSSTQIQVNNSPNLCFADTVISPNKFAQPVVAELLFVTREVFLVLLAASFASSLGELLGFKIEYDESVVVGDGFDFPFATSGGDLVKKLKIELCLAITINTNVIYPTKNTSVTLSLSKQFFAGNYCAQSKEAGLLTR